MATNEIRVFYSWQSDLPGNLTRYLIQDSIDAAVRALKNTIEVLADRDTKGILGTPDIPETIFKKIDECDLFIADVSIINKYSAYDDEGKTTGEVKYAPNPNVLIELGYAAAILGWDRIICIMNTDFGKIEDLPFDLDHRRPHGFSLSLTEKAVARKEIRDLIMQHVMDIMEKGPRAKSGYSNLIIGGFDFQQNTITKKSILLQTVRSLPGHQLLRKKLLNQCERLIQEILDCHVSLQNEVISESDLLTAHDFPIQPRDLLSQNLLSKITEPQPVVISEEERRDTTEAIDRLFSINIPETFFSFGTLQRKTTLYPQNTEYIGTEEEKKKYKKYEELRYILSQICILGIFVDSFEGMLVLPICVVNNSSHVDEDITVSIQINNGIPVEPSRHILNAEYRSSDNNTGLEGLVYDLGMIKEVFFLPEDHVQYDSDISYDIQDSIRESQRNVQHFFSRTAPDATAEDFEYELDKYIASINERSQNGTYVFEISGLRPQETKWLGPLILVKPSEKGHISLGYAIKSMHSPGIVEGTIPAE